MTKRWRNIVLFLAVLCLLPGTESRGLHQSERGAAGTVTPQRRGGGSGGGFLAAELPLEIVTTTPVAISTATEDVAVNGDQAITVVFSRPVIALGEDFGAKELPKDKVPFTLTPNVVGRFRWVTTYIARWDPENEWPLDFNIELKWNQNLTTHDGIPFRLGGVPQMLQLMTPTLSMNFEGVKSNKATNLTDGEWHSNVGLDTDHLPEVPPDGVFKVRFDVPVLTSVMNTELKVLNMNLEVVEELKPNSKPCEKRANIVPVVLCPDCKDGQKEESFGEASNCMDITIEGDLGVGTKYYISLAKGTKYSDEMGPLKREIRMSFGGLREFNLPWKRTDIKHLTTRVLDVWLPHGLQNGEKDLDKLKKQLNLTVENDKVDFELMMKNKGKVQILAKLQPRQTYRLSVEASQSVLDGYGLPLKDSSISISTAKVQSLYKPMQPSRRTMVFEASQDWGRKIVAVWKGRGVNRRCKLGELQSKVKIFQILSNKSIQALLPQLMRYVPSEPLTSTIEDPVKEATAQTNDEIGEIVEADISKLLKPTGIVAYEYCSVLPDAFVLMESFVQALVVGSSVGPSIVWVTSMETGEPIEGARVTPYESTKQTWERHSAADFDKLASSNTDKSGIAMLEETLRGNTHIHIEYKKRSLFVSQANVGYFEDPADTRVVLVLDRRLVRPGETLHAKGYILEHDGRLWKPSTKTGYTYTAFSISPELLIDAVPIELDAKFGTFLLRIPVPQNATFATYNVRVERDGSYLGGEDFVVADPRPPTVGLSIDAPVWAKPDTKIEVELTVESFIGSAVGDAEITLEWEIQGGLIPFSFETELGGEGGGVLNGKMVLTTDDSGKAVAGIDLSAFEVPPSPGSTLKIDATFVGPTRELVEETSFTKLELADLLASLEFTAFTEIPGHEFGVGVSLTNLAGVPFGTTPVTVELKELPKVQDGEAPPPRSEKASQPIEGVVAESCDTESGSSEWCRFKLPGVGNFALEACVTLGGEENTRTTVCTRRFIGKTTEQWKSNGPLDEHLSMGLLTLSKGPFKVGDVVKFGIENPYANARAIVAWGSSLGSDHKVIALDDFAFSEFFVELSAMCEFNCGVTVGVSVPRQKNGVAAKEMDIPVSKLFDLAAPHFVQLSETVKVEQDFSLDVRIPASATSTSPEETSQLVVPPRESTTIEIGVGGDKADQVEVTVIAVDKAVLELIPLKLRDLAMEFVLAYQGEFGLRDSSVNLIAPGAIEAIIEDFIAKAKLNPWFEPSLNLERDFLIDLTKEQYLDRVSEDITTTRARFLASGRTFAKFASGGAPPLPFSDAVPNGALVARLAGGAAPPAPPPPPLSGRDAAARVQDDFVATPLFETTVSENGVARVNFTAPDNLGTFIVRAYATSGQGKFGSAESELIVRRKVSLTPSAPRFVRVGDEFEAGAVLTTSDPKASPTVDVKVDVEGPSQELLEIVSDSEASIEIGADGTSEVRFMLKAKSIGEASFRITADDGSGGSDALVIDVPVEGLQEKVSLASSFAIDGANGSSWQEGLQLPEAVAGSGGVIIQAGVGRLPAILSLAGQIYARNPTHECPVSADLALALAAIPFITESYGVLGLAKNELEPGTAEMLNGMIANFTAAVTTLEDVTTEELGLRYRLGCPSFGDNSFAPKEPSIWQNARGAWVMRELGEDIRNSLLEGAQRGVVSLVELEEDWLGALEAALVAEATRSRRERGAPISVDTVAFARAVLWSWSPPQFTPATVVKDLSMERLSDDLNIMGAKSRAFYILELLRRNPVEHHPDVKVVIDEWTSNFRVTGRTAYVAATLGSSTPASNAANSLALMAMTRAGVSSPLIEKLANYVGSPHVGAYGFRVFSDFDKTVAMVALRDYDQSRGSTTPDISLDVRSGGVELLTATFKRNSDPIESSTIPWQDLDSPPKPLEFTAQGTGEITLAASLTFVPKRLLPFPTYRGIFLERIIRMPDSNGSSLNKVPVGSVVDIQIQITTPDRLGLTTVRAMMPAGLEPVDPSVERPGGFSCPIVNIEVDGGGRRQQYPWAQPFYFFTCPEQETKPSMVTFTFTEVNAGTATITFRAVAATAGTFALPPIRAFVNNQPEVMGLSSAGELVVCSGCAPQEGAPLAAPQSCPNNCSNNGACNLDSGECVCLTGFTGDDCANLVAA